MYPAHAVEHVFMGYRSFASIGEVLPRDEMVNQVDFGAVELFAQHAPRQPDTRFAEIRLQLNNPVMLLESSPTQALDRLAPHRDHIQIGDPLRFQLELEKNRIRL